MSYSPLNKKVPRRKIGLRLSLYTLVVSSFFAFISVAILVYIESKEIEGELAKQTSEIVSTIERPLSQHLRYANYAGVEEILENISQLHYVKGINLTNNQGQEFIVGIQTYPDSFSQDIFSQKEKLGVLRIGYDVNEFKVASIAKYQPLIIVALLAISLMTLAFYFVVNKMLIRHIAFISRAAKTFALEDTSTFTPLALTRKPRNDEMTDLEDAINEGRRSAIELLQAKKDYEEQMEYQSNFDLLTGLPNRRHLYEYLNIQLTNYTPDKGHFIILFIDLDGFKYINDSMGHGVGDKVLYECAMRLHAVAEKLGGYIARLGGDEFFICLYDHDINLYKEASKNILDGFKKKISAGDIQVKLGCSIGVTLYPEHQADYPRAIINNADSALCKAKAAGKNTFFCFDELTRKEQELESSIKSKLNLAIENEVFQVNYQPLVDIQKNKIIGFEALVRWHDDELGWVSPDIFIAIAEKTGVVFDIDRWVFETSVKQVEKWRSEFCENFILSINFSPSNFYHGQFPQWAAENKTLQSKNIDWIELEVTERLILNDEPIVWEGINFLLQKGIRFSMDDFGMGYSSLGYIKKFSHMLSKIKIDRIFISEILITDFDIAFVKSIMMLSDSLGLKVLAEGVEEKEQVNLLKSIGCEYAQGYYFSEAIPANKIEELIDAWDSDDEIKEQFDLIYQYNNSSPREL